MDTKSRFSDCQRIHPRRDYHTFYPTSIIPRVSATRATACTVLLGPYSTVLRVCTVHVVHVPVYCTVLLAYCTRPLGVYSSITSYKDRVISTHAK